MFIVRNCGTWSFCLSGCREVVTRTPRVDQDTSQCVIKNTSERRIAQQNSKASWHNSGIASVLYSAGDFHCCNILISILESEKKPMRHTMRY